MDNWWWNGSRTYITRAYFYQNISLRSVETVEQYERKRARAIKSTQATQIYDLCSLLNQPRQTSNKLSNLSLSFDPIFYIWYILQSAARIQIKCVLLYFLSPRQRPFESKFANQIQWTVRELMWISAKH